MAYDVQRHYQTSDRTMLGERAITCSCGHVAQGGAYDTIATQNFAYHLKTVKERNAGLTDDEFAVLAGIDATEYYQPPAELEDAANKLLLRGLVEKDAAWPDTLAATQLGWDIFKEHPEEGR